MANVIAVVKDDRTRRQIEQFLQELGMEDLRFATFQSSEEFQALYFRDRSQDPPPEENPDAAKPEAGTEGEEGAELKLFSEIHLFIFSLDSLGEKSTPWIDKLKINLKKFKYWPESGPPRFVMLKYEDDGLSKMDVMHPLLDDLIYQPIDRLVFLQKIDIFLTLPKKVTPRFLFNQEVNQGIEISKISKIDRLSDVGLAIRNPVPLQKGLPGHFYIQLPGEKTRLEVRAKVFKSEPHPEYPGLFLVYFSYFGINKAALTQIRRALSKAPNYKSIIKDDRNLFRYNPDSLWNDASTSGRPFGCAVIDADDTVANSLPQSLAKEMDRVSAFGETSYQVFLQKFLEKDQGDKTPPKSTEDADFYKVPISMSIAADLKCLSVDPGPTDEDKFLGHPARQLFATPDAWVNLLKDKQSKLILEEAVQLAGRGRVLEKMIVLKHADGSACAVSFKIYRGATEGVVTVDLGPANLAAISAHTEEVKADTKLDVMIVDTSFVPEEPSSWIEGLRTRSVQVGLNEKPDGLKFFLTTESEKSSLNLLNSKDVLGLFIKPIDSRQLLFLLSEFLPNEHTLYGFKNIGWSQPNMPVHVSKNVDLEMLSEFGATLRTKQKLVPGTIIYLRKGIFDNAPNQCLAARVYACEEHPKDKGYFQVSTTYFGINDAFLKFARTWIRENYAQQKKEGG